MCLSAKSVIRTTALCLAALLPVALGAQAQVKQRVAIFEPEEEVPKGEKPQLKAMTRAIIWGALEEGLVSTGRYTFLDRSRVSQAMKELNIQRDFNIYDQAGRKDFQQRLAADLICMTSVVKEKKGINVRVSIMNVETGEIEHSAQDYRATNKDQEIAMMVKNLAARVIPTSTNAITEKDDVVIKEKDDDKTIEFGFSFIVLPPFVTYIRGDFGVGLSIRFPFNDNNSLQIRGALILRERGEIATIDASIEYYLCLGALYSTIGAGYVGYVNDIIPEKASSPSLTWSFGRRFGNGSFEYRVTHVKFIGGKDKINMAWSGFGIVYLYRF